MYTTTRYSSVKTRKMAEKLAKRDKQLYSSRGKKTIEELVLFARRKGEEVVNIIGEKNKEPVTISCLDVLEKGGWRWKEKQKI